MIPDYEVLPPQNFLINITTIRYDQTLLTKPTLRVTMLRIGKKVDLTSIR